jgi:diguanylate cyclase (GGDEF)-like protein
MIAPSALAMTVFALAFASAGLVVVLRALAAVRACRAALLAERARRTVLLDAARRLSNAARDSGAAVRDEIVHAARALVPGADGVIVYEEEDGELRCAAAFGDRFAYFAGTRAALADPASLPSRALVAGHRVTLADPGVAPLHPADAAALAFPLALEAGHRCVLVFAATHALDGESGECLAAIAEQAAPAYAAASERELDRRRAEYDGLTGLLTPRALRQRLSALIDRARFVPSARLALLFVDTDHFKRWNDRCGHAAGDALLREIARELRCAARREEDLVARNGGDEFCLVFTETDKATAIERAEALRRRIGALEVAQFGPADAEDTIRITASIGVAAYAADASTASGLLERADAAMYHSKETGRDGVSYVAVGGALERLAAGALSA